MEKLKDYQVLDVFSAGTLYKVRHKVTNSIFAWKAYDCSAFSDEQIQNVDNEVKILSKVLSGNFLRYYDTILHNPTKTLYFVLEYVSWQTVQELISICKATDKHFTEKFIWYILLELARICKIIENLNFVHLKKCLLSEAIFVGPNGELRLNCFELCSEAPENVDLTRQIGEVIRTLCYLPGACDDEIKEFQYSNDLRDVITFLTDPKTENLSAQVVIYHPTVLSHMDTLAKPFQITDILTSKSLALTSEANMCDSEKEVEQCKSIEPLPRTYTAVESPIYYNISPNRKLRNISPENNSPWEPVSPVIAALALELPGYVPQTRKPYIDTLDRYNGPQKMSEETLSQQWMSRLIALRQREESLNKRERNLIAKEILSSPSVTVISRDNSTERDSSIITSNGITLPQVFNQPRKEICNNWVSRRRRRRSSSVRSRNRRKSYNYEDLDSSLSADNGDSSMIITAAKITANNMPCRNIFPQISSKKVQFTSKNPFVESDESVTLTFYELENKEGYQKSKSEEKLLKDVTKFKYFDKEKLSTEKRLAMWNNSSPTKQAKVAGKIFTDITNKGSKQTLSKTIHSLKHSNLKDSNLNFKESDQINSNDNSSCIKTPKALPEHRKSKRMSLLHFKTPFKFKTSTKV